MKQKEAVELDLPIVIVGLLAVAMSTYDAGTEFRHFGGQELRGRGIAIGSDSYTVGQGRVEVDGKWMPTILLSIRRQFYGDKAMQSTETYEFPMEDLRRIVFSTKILTDTKLAIA